MVAAGSLSGAGTIADPNQEDTLRRLQLLLSEAARTDETRSTLVQALEALGCTVTGVGAATLSVRVSEAVYCRLFEAAAGPADPARTGRSTAATAGPRSSAATADAGSSAAEPSTLRIPAPLRHYLSSISEAPPHQSFSGPPPARPDAVDRHNDGAGTRPRKPPRA